MLFIFFYLVLYCYCSICSFFFSSRRRHTRWPRDWSSDVCSSDLTLFHPLAIENALARILSLTYYTKDEIFKYGELYFSWDHHSSFNQISIDQTLEKINYELEFANQFIRNTDVFLLTFGTAWVYKIKDTELYVANCHKVPN